MTIEVRLTAPGVKGRAVKFVLKRNKVPKPAGPRALVLLELLLVALARPGLGAEDPRCCCRLKPGGGPPGCGSPARPRCVASRLGWTRLGSSLPLREVRRPRRVAEPALLVAAREVEQRVQRAGRVVDVGRRIADRRAAASGTVSSRRSPGSTSGTSSQPARTRPARPASGAPSRRTRRCGRARSGCSRRTRRGAPPSTTCSSPARARAARSRARAPARRAAPPGTPTRARSAR